MRLISILSSVLMRPIGIVSMLVVSLCAFGLIFIMTERALLFDVLSGTFPLPLFFDLLPGLFQNFLFGGGTSLLLHYILISLLLGVYITLLLHIFVRRRYFSLSSFSMSVFGLAGITLGISCLGCGAIAGVLLLSILGAAGSSALLTLESTVFLIAGELLLLASIVLALFTIKKLQR